MAAIVKNEAKDMEIETIAAFLSGFPFSIRCMAGTATEDDEIRRYPANYYLSDKITILNTPL